MYIFFFNFILNLKHIHTIIFIRTKNVKKCKKMFETKVI